MISRVKKAILLDLIVEGNGHLTIAGLLDLGE